MRLLMEWRMFINSCHWILADNYDLPDKSCLSRIFGTRSKHKMDNNVNNYDDEEKEARKKKKSRHRDEERRNKTRDDDEERKERRREKKSKKVEEGGEGDEEEEERRRRKRKERERLKQLEDQEAPDKRDSDDHEKRKHLKRKDSPDDSKLTPEVAALEEHGNSKLSTEQNLERLSLDKPQTRPSKNDEDDEANFKIMKPSQRAKVEKEPIMLVS